MLASIARLAALVIVLAGVVNSRALADDLADFNAAAEQMESHNRVAIGYLRTGNIDLASIELDRVRDAWAKLNAGKRPSVFDGNTYYVVATTDIATRLITADLMMNSGHPDVTRDALLAAREDLYKLRKSAGISVLSDCIYDANIQLRYLVAFDKTATDFGDAATVKDLRDAASASAAALDRCDKMANDKVRNEPEFRRLVDGSQISLKNISQAIADRDTDLLHRVLIELQSFENLLAFRFG
jgi:hypothetical protein